MNDAAALSRADAPDRIAELEREVAKLRKINLALMNRVERSMDAQGSAFSVFEAAILLESKVRDRTRQLEDTLHALERSNTALASAKEAAETAQSRLQDAIDSVIEGFALFDSDDRLILCNQSYLDLWPGIADAIRPGVSFGEIARLVAEHGLNVSVTPLRWVSERMAQHAEPGGSHVHVLADGRWIQINERRTRDGGVVGVYTDITNVKERDARDRARELAEKSVLLQSTLDNIPQGVCVYDGMLQLVAWNDPVVRLLNLPRDVVRPDASYQSFLEHNAGLGGRGFPPEFTDWDPQHPSAVTLEHAWHNGRILEVRRNPMPAGGFVMTFTDITERKRIEQALRDGEQRIRLITDGIPAHIAYVDADERYVFVNKRYERVFGRARENIIGMAMAELLGPEAYASRQAHVRKALAGESAEFELTLPGRSGMLHILQGVYIPHFGPDNSVLGFFALMQDVTESRRAAIALQEANENLERRVAERTAALQGEVAERRAVEAELRVAKTAAEQANLSKTKFLAAASHDLLQPLNAVRLFVSALCEMDHAPETRNLLGKTDSALLSVESLLDSLLEISKLDAGAVQPDVRDFAVSDLLRNMQAEFAPFAAERGLTLKVVQSDAVVRSDMRLLRRILQNFISNALRYTRKGRVVVGCRHTPAGLRLDVADTGPGIPIDKRDEIFEEFRRLEREDASDPSRSKGMGLGLAIVDRAARMLGHPIRLRSTEGRGSVFSVTVPYGAAEPAAAMPSRPKAAPRSPLTDARILVLDNERAILEGMGALLRGWGCNVEVAATGDDALWAFGGLSRGPDVIVVDYHLADGALGVDELVRLRAACGREVAGLVITADRTPEVMALMQAHALPVLTKPVKPAQLRALLTQLLP
jgi:two-component system, sensor histidine kinase